MKNISEKAEAPTLKIKPKQDRTMKTDLGRKTFNNKLVGHAVQEPQDGCLLTPEMGIHKKWLKIVTFLATFH